MKTFLLVFIITFIVLAGSAWLINYCRRRAGRTRHGLTGMCHKSGGSMCACCGSELLAKGASRSVGAVKHEHC